MVKHRLFFFFALFFRAVFSPPCKALILAFMLWNQAAMAAVVAEVDRTQMSDNESLTLSIVMTEGDKGSPDTSPLNKDFDIASRSQSSSYSLINGRMSSESRLQLVLFPKRSGRLSIPALAVGKATTQAISIEVSSGATSLPQGSANPAQSARKLGPRVEMQLDASQVYVQQQLILTVRIYQGGRLVQASLTEPKVDSVVIEKLGDDKSYQTVEKGRRWQITERKYALFPQKSGHIIIAPIQLDGQVSVGQRQTLFFQNSRPIRVRSNAVEVDVKPIPAAWQGGEWLPAQQLRLQEQWTDSENLQVGEPVTRTLTVQAVGLSSKQLPILSEGMNDLFDGALKTYADKPVLTDKALAEGWLAQRQEKIAVIPAKVGNYGLPAIEVPWWNTATDSMEVARIVPRTVRVKAAATAVSSMPPSSSMPLSAGNVQAVTGGDYVASTGHSPWWKYLFISSSIGWLMTLLWFLVFRSGHAAPFNGHYGRSKAIINPNARRLKKAVQQACENNKAKACEQALLQWARFTGHAVGNLLALAAASDKGFSQAIIELEQALYGANQGVRWQGGAGLWQAFQHSAMKKTAQTGMTGQAKPTKKTLPALYPE